MTEQNRDSTTECPATTPVPTPVRPPNRPAHEKLLEEVGARLGAKEERRKFLGEQLKVLRDRQGQARAEKEGIGEERKKVDEGLTALNKQVDAKRDEVQRVRAGLPYLNEEHIQDQIKNLEYQLRKYNFKPAEEKKIIVEIDRLNRSKRLLKEHNVLKLELDGLRTSQRQIRERRDNLFRQRGDVNKRESNMKRDAREIREELDRLKAEVDALNEEKREAVSAFRAHESEYKRYLYERREENRAKRREEKEEREAEKIRELEEIKANQEPYDEELKLISNLMAYSLRFEVPSTANGPNSTPSPSVHNGFLCVPGSTTSTGSSVYSTPVGGVTPATTPQTPGGKGGLENCFVYKKEDAADELFAGTAKKNRRNSKNDRRNSKTKLLNHNPEIYAQFGKFELKPPATTKDVVSVIEALKEKQQYFERKALEEKAARAEGSSTSPSSSSLKPPSPKKQSATVENKVSVSVTSAEEEDDAVDSSKHPEVSTGYNEEAFPSLPVVADAGNGGFFRQASAPSSAPEPEQSIVGAKTKPAPPAASDTALLKSLTEDLKKDLHLGEGGQDL